MIPGDKLHVKFSLEGLLKHLEESIVLKLVSNFNTGI